MLRYTAVGRMIVDTMTGEIVWEGKTWNSTNSATTGAHMLSTKLALGLLTPETVYDHVRELDMWDTAMDLVYKIAGWTM